MDAYTFLEEVEMLDALKKAGQFCHVAESKFHTLLSDIWDGVSSDRDYGEEYTAVPKSIWRAHRRGAAPKLFLVHATFIRAEERFGVLCCLCGKIDNTRSGYGVSDEFIDFACPTATFLDDIDSTTDEPTGERFAAAYPFCKECSRLSRRICSKLPDHAAALAEILISGGPDFKARVSIYAKNWSLIRFDPRRAFTAAAAA